MSKGRWHCEKTRGSVYENEERESNATWRARERELYLWEDGTEEQEMDGFARCTRVLAALFFGTAEDLLCCMFRN